MAATFHTYGRLLHHTQYECSRWCIVQCPPLHCNNFEFTIYLMIVSLLSTALFQYLKCEDQRISKNCRSTFIFCSSWNLWGGPIFYVLLARGGGAHPCPPRQLRHWLSAHSAFHWWSAQCPARMLLSDKLIVVVRRAQMSVSIWGAVHLQSLSAWSMNIALVCNIGKTSGFKYSRLLSVEAEFFFHVLRFLGSQKIIYQLCSFFENIFLS